MHALLTIGLGVAGAGLVATGWWRHLVRRRRERAGAARLPRWPARTAMAVGALLLLVPDVLAGLVVPAPVGTGVGEALVIFLGVLYRLVVLIGLGVVALSLAMMSEHVLRPLDRLRARWMPGPEGRAARALRRTPVGRGLPRDQQALVTYELALGEHLLHYQRDAEAAFDRPALADLSDPVTAAAWQALFHAESLRPQRPLPTSRDVLSTDYGRAVLDLARAVTEAERYAAHAATAGLSDDERVALDEAGRVLEFIRTEATGPGERAAAYEAVINGLTAARPAGATTSSAGDASTATVASPAVASSASAATAQQADAQQADAAGRSHPWLEITERASRRDP